MNILLTKELYEFIENEIKEFHKYTNDYYQFDLELEDIFYTLLYSEDDKIYILNDWNEGRNSEPMWDDIKDKHMVESFLEDIYFKIKVKLND